MRFSKENLRRVKEELAKGEGALELMPDDDFAVAMRQNEDGGFMLKFASGRVVSVDELYRYARGARASPRASHALDVRGRDCGAR